MQLKLIIIICAVAALTVGCSTPTPRPEPTITPPVEPVVNQPVTEIQAPPVPDPAVSAVGWWFDYYRNMSEQPPSVITKEYKTAEAAFSSDKSLQNRLRLVSLLSLRDTSFHNPEHAVKLLDELTGNVQPPLRNAALVWRSNLLAELEDNKRIQALSGQVKEMQTTNKEIQNQLNALKEIERNLYERNKGEVTNKR